MRNCEKNKMSLSVFRKSTILIKSDKYVVTNMHVYTLSIIRMIPTSMPKTFSNFSDVRSILKVKRLESQQIILVLTN